MGSAQARQGFALDPPPFEKGGPKLSFLLYVGVATGPRQTEAQRSGFGLERTSSEGKEFSRLRGNE